jgi:uncharacterized membrane protein (DUF485 family)
MSHSPPRPAQQRAEPALDLVKVESNPAFRTLCAARRRLGVTSAIIMAGSYFAFILTVAFSPGALGTPVANGTVITWGLVAGVAVIALGLLLTAIYVLRANARFDGLVSHLLEDVR